jgi:hypothetical protein
MVLKMMKKALILLDLYSFFAIWQISTKVRTKKSETSIARWGVVPRTWRAYGTMDH